MEKHSTAPAPAAAPPAMDLAALLCDEEIGQRDLNELMDALLVTALEGGSTYWLSSFRCDGPQPKPWAFGETGDVPWYTVACRAGVTAKLRDDDGGKHTFDRAKGITGLQLLLAGKHCAARIVSDLIAEKACADAEVADVWLQLAALGEVVYG